jgi:CheY-like chemotaxis protein
MLRYLGYRVSTVASGEAAEAFVRDAPVDLLVLDMIMEPGIDGQETLRRILDFRPGQKAIIASGYAESEKVKETLLLGAAGFVKKPYSLEQIGRAVKAALPAG